MNAPSRQQPVKVHIDGDAAFRLKTMFTFWALWAVFWLLMISVSMENELRNPFTRWWEPVLWEGSSALVSTAWMFLAFRVRGRYALYLDTPLIWFASYLRLRYVWRDSRFELRGTRIALRQTSSHNR